MAWPIPAAGVPPRDGKISAYGVRVGDKLVVLFVTPVPEVVPPGGGRIAPFVDRPVGGSVPVVPIAAPLWLDVKLAFSSTVN